MQTITLFKPYYKQTYYIYESDNFAKTLSECMKRHFKKNYDSNINLLQQNQNDFGFDLQKLNDEECKTYTNSKINDKTNFFEKTNNNINSIYQFIDKYSHTPLDFEMLRKNYVVLTLISDKIANFINKALNLNDVYENDINNIPESIINSHVMSELENTINNIYLHDNKDKKFYEDLEKVLACLQDKMEMLLNSIVKLVE